MLKQLIASTPTLESSYRAGIDCIQVPDLIAPTEVQKEQTICIVKDLIEAKDYIKENRVHNATK